MRILTVAREDLRLILRDRSSIFWVFLAPFLWVFFFGQLAGGGGDGSQVQIGLTVIRQDDSATADRFVELLSAENFDVAVYPDAGSIPEEVNPVRILTIPAGFAGAIERREKVTLPLEVISDNASPDATVAAEVMLHRAIVRVLADETFGEPDPDSGSVTLKSEWAGRRKVPSGYYQTIPGYLVMFVLIATLTYGAAGLANDRKKGLLSRLAISPITRSEIMLGKLAGRGAVAALQALVFILMGLTLFRIDWGASPIGLALLLITYISCAAALSFLAGALFKSPDAAAGVGVAVAMLMSALGGCWWPAEVMPDWLRTASRIFPSAWAMDGLHRIISWGGGLGDVALHCVVLALFALGAGTLGARLLRMEV